MTYSMKLTGLVLTLALVALPGCGLQSLIVPLIDRGLDELFNDDQEGDLIPDDTAIGEAVDLEIALGGRVCCDPADGANQRVTIVTIRHTGTNDSDPITFEFVPETETKLSASPASGTLAPGEVATVNIFASDCDFFVQEFLMRTFFTGDQGVPDRSTTATVIVRNVCAAEEPVVDAFLALLDDPTVQATLADRIALVEYGEPVKHGDVSVPDRIPDIPLSQIDFYGSLDVNLDVTAIEDAFIGSSPAFPLGSGSDISVYAADTQVGMTPGDYRVIFFGLDGTFGQIDSSRHWRFAVAVDSDGQAGNNFVPDAQFANDPLQGTDRWYLLDYVPGEGWSVRLIDATGTEQGSALRVIQLANALVFVIPKSEIPGPGAGYRVVSFTHTGDGGMGANHDWSGDHHPTPDLAALAD